MDRLHHLVWICRQNGEGFQRLAVIGPPALPQAGKGVWFPALERNSKRAFRFGVRSLPLEIGICGHQATALLERLPESRLRRRLFSAGVDGGIADLGFFRPKGILLANSISFVFNGSRTNSEPPSTSLGRAFGMTELVHARLRSAVEVWAPHPIRLRTSFDKFDSSVPRLEMAVSWLVSEVNCVFQVKIIDITASVPVLSNLLNASDDAH